ncbi:MAG: hypothetical protein RR598_11500 [Anaerorhabdus sp.]
MDRDQSLRLIEQYISQANSSINQGVAVGFISACYHFGLIDANELAKLHDRALGLDSKDDQ